MWLAAVESAQPGESEATLPFVLVESRRDLATLVLPAAHANAAAVASMVRNGSGFLCVAIPDDLADTLGLPPMVRGGRRLLGGVAAVTVDAATGVGTGISAADRARTLRLLADPTTHPDELSRPGHVVPIRVSHRSAKHRLSPSQAAIALVSRFGHAPVAALTGLVSTTDSRRMAGALEARHIAAQLGFEVVVA